MNNVLMILNFLLIVIAIVFFVKNFIIKYIASFNDGKNLLFVALILACLILSINGVVKCAQVDELREILKIQSYFLEDRTIQMFTDDIKILTKSIVKTVSIGYGCLLAAILLKFNFQREFLKELAKPKYRWDWSKIILKRH